MDKMADVLGRAGAWCGQNKYLSAIKNAFQNFMPLTIAGAIGVLWCNVLVNETTGLGMFLQTNHGFRFLKPSIPKLLTSVLSAVSQLVSLLVSPKKSVFGTWELKELVIFQV